MLKVILVLFVTVECIESVSYVSASKITAVRVVHIDCVEDCLTLHHISAHDAGVCQVADVELVAVSTCQLDGAAADDILIVVVAD